MKIYLVRHAISQFNAGLTDRFNSAITAKGEEQANRVALTLKKEGMGFIGYTSPYLRCLQTANIIWQHTEIRFRVTHLLGETPEEIHRNTDSKVYNMNLVGEFSDFNWTGFPDYWDYANESAEAYQKRMKDFEALLDDRDCFIISHRAPIRDLIRNICFDGKPEPLTVPNCSISLIEDGKPVYIGKMP